MHLSMLWKRLMNLLLLIRLFHSKKPDIVHLHNMGALPPYIWILSYVFRFKLIITLHGYNILELPTHPAHKHWIFARVLERANHVTACSAAVLADATKRVPCIKNKSSVIFNGIDLSEFKDTRKYSWPHPYILCLANPHLYKGIDILLMAFSHVIKTHPEVTLILAGDGGGALESCREFATLLKIHEHVAFLGEINNRSTVIALLNGCEFCVLPSRWEPFGIALLEAMAAGKAIITTAIGGPPEFIQDGIQGLLVKPKDVNALADAIKKLLNDRALIESLGTNGKKCVQNFSWETMYKKYRTVYNTILS